MMKLPRDIQVHDTALQSCPTLCDTMDYSLPGSSVQGILQARILERVAISSSRGSSQPRNRTWVSCVSCIGQQILSLPLAPPGKSNNQVRNRECK